MRKPAVIVAALLSACTGEPSGESEDITLTAEEIGIWVGTTRVDKPGTFGEVYYTVLLRDTSALACLVTTDELTATWSGTPMIVLSAGQSTPSGGCTQTQLAIARSEVTGENAAIVIRDAGKQISAAFKTAALRPGNVVPAVPTWELAAGTVATFQWSLPTFARDPELCFMTATGAWSTCVKGTWDNGKKQTSFAIPAAPELTGEGTALFKLGNSTPFPTACNAAACYATIFEEQEHPATVTVP